MSQDEHKPKKEQLLHPKETDLQIPRD